MRASRNLFLCECCNAPEPWIYTRAAQEADYMKDFDSYLYGHNHIKGCWEHHLEWCPKYRYNALGKESVRQDCELAIRQAAEDIEAEVLELAVMPDHVHVVLRTRKPMHPSYLLFRLKGRSAYELFRKHPNIRKRYPKGHFWSRGNMGRTVGADIETTRHYVRNQRDIHQKNLQDWAS